MSLELTVWNVQHGSAVHIQTPNDKHIVVDLGTGTSDTGNFSPLSHLKNQGIPQLDWVIISHPHLDHIEDILNFDQLKPLYLTRPNHLTEDDIWAGNKNADAEVKQVIRKYIEIDTRYNLPADPQSSPRLPENNGDASIEVFSPAQSSHANLNNHSIVTVISYCGVKILIPGDNEPPSWDELLKRSDFKAAIADVSVLVAPHHGRESGFHSELFNHFQPLITIISDGRFLDTSATDRYSAVTKGWQVNRRNGSPQRRKCVTTRNDGIIAVKIGKNPNGRAFLSVLID